MVIWSLPPIQPRKGRRKDYPEICASLLQFAVHLARSILPKVQLHLRFIKERHR